MNAVPVWAKTVGIIMICLASLGLIAAVGKITFPSTVQMQQDIMNGMGEFDNNPRNPFQGNIMSTMKNLMVISKFQAYTVMVSGIVGLIGCGFYLFAGIKLLKLDPKNLRLAKTALIGFMTINALTIALVLTDGYSMMVLGAIFYPILGLVFDVALLIVINSSDKSAYYKTDLSNDHKEPDEIIQEEII